MQAGRPSVCISRFATALHVIESKQRPRKLYIHGSDGVSYGFLLKGHEDLRQDERVMQLFGLINTLLQHDPDTSKHDLVIRRCAVIPLAPNSGLIEWMPNTDTLHSQIKEFRDARKILLNIEHRIIQQFAPDYADLPLIRKVEVFEYALANTTGQDLAKVLWLKSANSEVWLERRTNYTRSLAIMSMVGYILGLGDRHPCNLMLDQFSGKIVHIDFGDCFEVAMQRDKFPEKVPFRLTRMLVNAMEVSGIEGNFRSIAESVMRVLRQNKESVMAVLEAFVHDPLINWRLLKKPSEAPRHGSPQADGKIAKPESSLESANYNVILSQTKTTPRSESHSLSQPNDPDASSAVGADNDEPSEILNERALKVIERVRKKLHGRDFDDDEVLDVPDQVQRLIQQATSFENLCQCYVGWCPLW